MRHLILSLFLAFSTGGTLSTSAFADSPSEDGKRAARAAAKAGHEALVDGRYDEALKFLKRAEKEFHAPTHLLMMAEAHEKLGQLVEAREVLLALVHEKVKDEASDAFHDARTQASSRLEELEPRVPRVTIRARLTQVGQALNADESEVSLNGLPVPSSAYDVPYPVNPGKYEAILQSHRVKSEPRSFELQETEQETIELSLDLPATVALETSVPSAASPSPGTHPMVYVGLGIGAAGAIAGSVTGILALSKVSSLKKDHCQGDECDPDFEGDFKSAETLGWVSTASFAVAAGGVAVGVYYLLSGDKSDAAKDTGSLQPQVEFSLARDHAYANASWSF